MDSTHEHKVPPFVNSKFMVASEGDGACHYRGKISESGGARFQAKPNEDKPGEFLSSSLDAAGKGL